MSSRHTPVLAFAFLLFSAMAALAQPAVPPLPGARPAAPPAAAAPAAAPAARPAATADAPPTSDAAPGQAAPARAAADAPPISEAPAQTASAAPNAAPAVAEPAPLPATVARNYPLTAEGNARFLAEYAARPDVKKLTGGVLYRVLHAAEAKAPGPMVTNDTVTVTYRGWLIDGTVFDQTRPGVPMLFSLGGVIPGWRTALLKMKVGDLWEIAVPSDQAYGEEGRPGRIPPSQTLIFVVSLAKVEYAG